MQRVTVELGWNCVMVWVVGEGVLRQERGSDKKKDIGVGGYVECRMNLNYNLQRY